VEAIANIKKMSWIRLGAGANGGFPGRQPQQAARPIDATHLGQQSGLLFLLNA
jgi:hypothetical protein